MQKIDFIENLETIVNLLYSETIVSSFNGGFSKPKVRYNYAEINPLLFMSKSRYDQIKNNVRYKDILSTTNADGIYNEANLSFLTLILRETTAHDIIINKSAVDLFNFHNSLIQTLSISRGLLGNDSIADSYRKEVDNGIVVFQIVIDGSGLTPEKYIKIFTLINELVEVVSKVVNEADEKSEFILLDSGSDTNIGWKGGIETAKSLFLIFKEVWDFLANHKYYKQKRKNETLMESLSMRTIINQKIADRVLSKEEGLIYIQTIKSRTDDLIGMKVLPKQIMNESNQTDSKKMLAEIEEMKMLSMGENNGE